MTDRFTASLRYAGLASSAFSVLVTIQKEFPELQQLLEQGKIYLHGSWGCVFKRFPQINGEHLVLKTPLLNFPKPIKYSEPADDWEEGCDPDASRCKALLLEVLRRAAHDWVLYRLHTRLELKEIADDAYTWLFEEEEDHPNYRQRESAVIETSQGEKVRGARTITSFLSVCEFLGLEPEMVRERVRRMDVRAVTSSGRPTEPFGASTEPMSVEEHGMMVSVDMDSMPSGDYVSSYESYGSIATPSRLHRDDW